MNRRAVLIHGGGPTAVLNASLAGLALELRRAGHWSLAGARFGFAGLLAEDFLDLDAPAESLLEQIALAPGSALGSSRHPLDEAGYERAVEILLHHGITTAFLNGGNGTMRAARHLAESAGARLQVIGIPKTIDNDIPGTDHTPGYGSVARFFAHAVRDAGEDNRSLPSPVMVVETLAAIPVGSPPPPPSPAARPKTPPTCSICPSKKSLWKPFVATWNAFFDVLDAVSSPFAKASATKTATPSAPTSRWTATAASASPPTSDTLSPS